MQKSDRLTGRTVTGKLAQRPGWPRGWKRTWA